MFLSKKIDSTHLNKRLDSILVDLKLVETRQKAISLIMTGNVFFGEKKIQKPGKLIKSEGYVRVKKKEFNWVSRGGVKLFDALKKFRINVKDKICLDIGCSTGGFSQVLLNSGAKKIYAVDVGYGQFDWRLRNSKKINLIEKTNARNLNKELISEYIDLVVCDVSFISMRKVIEPTKKLLNKNYEILGLIKPQFEVERGQVGKGGIIKDEKLHKDVCNKLQKWFELNFKSTSIQLIESVITGQKGNKEFFIFVRGS